MSLPPFFYGPPGSPQGPGGPPQPQGPGMFPHFLHGQFPPPPHSPSPPPPNASSSSSSQPQGQPQSPASGQMPPGGPLPHMFAPPTPEMMMQMKAMGYPPMPPHPFMYGPPPPQFAPGAKLTFQDLSQLAMYQMPPPPPPPTRGQVFDLKAIEDHINGLLSKKDGEETSAAPQGPPMPVMGSPMRSERDILASPARPEAPSQPLPSTQKQAPAQSPQRTLPTRLTIGPSSADAEEEIDGEEELIIGQVVIRAVDAALKEEDEEEKERERERRYHEENRRSNSDEESGIPSSSGPSSPTKQTDDSKPESPFNNRHTDPNYVSLRDRTRRKVPKNLNYGARLPIKKSDLTIAPNKLAQTNTQLTAIFNSLRPPRADFEKRMVLLGKLQKMVSDKWPKDSPKLHLFGSSANDFCLRRGDIDMCLTIDENAGSRKQIVLKLGEMLKRQHMKKILTLVHARVPIVKFFDPVSNFSCDICINNLLALKNTRLLADYSKIDPRVRFLVYVVKHWAKRRMINEPYRGTLSSYGYVLLVLHFLQQRKPPIIPCLQRLRPGDKELLDRGIDSPNGWTESIVEGFDCSYYTDVDKLVGYGKENKETNAELLERFFHFYTYEFDYHNQVISVRTGTFLRKEEKSWVQAVNGTLRDNYYLTLEDPFEITHNLGRVVDKDGLRTIQWEFKRAHYELCTAGGLPLVFSPYDEREFK